MSDKDKNSSRFLKRAENQQLETLKEFFQRLALTFVDFIANFNGDSSIAHGKIDGYIDYGDDRFSKPTNFECSTQCLKGRYDGNLDIRNSRHEEGLFKVDFNFQN